MLASMEEPVAVEPVKPAPPSAPAPIMDIKVPPPAHPAAPATSSRTTPTGNKSVYADPTAAAAAKAAPKKPPAKGVNAAIFATVVIILGLAALAVYAYTKTK
jgi:hypothetical protein